MLDFAVNVWPGQRPPALQAVLADALANGERYPDESEARSAIAARHRRSPDEVLLTNGACDAFWLIAHAYRPKTPALIHPSFTEPEAALLAAGSDVVHVLREPERWTFDASEVPADADCVVLGNPNNPTGTLEPPATLTALARRGRLLVIDESFIDFVASERASLAGHHEIPGLIVVRSLTKLWSLAGIRAGYLLAPAEIVERLAANRQPWSVNSLACAALTACAGDRDTPRRVAADVAVARTELADALARLPGVRVWPSVANFLLIRVADGPGVVEGLRQRGIAVRPAASFPGLDQRYIRTAVRTRDDNAILVEACTELLS
jgi:histidinol-phosphate/aromatic aminotransferase/cobyric acid decarboxylase-like protein